MSEQSASRTLCKPQPEADPCPRCDFASGYRGMDRCPACDGTGSVLRRDGVTFPNTEDGARAMAERSQPEATADDEWRPMNTAPHDAKWVRVRMADGKEHRAHWACDLSGEEQPPFRGWFIRNSSSGFIQISEPVAWKPVAQSGGVG